MKNCFYRAFEDRFRGSRELILERLEVYRDFLRPLAELFESPAAVGLGCGRGEFPELLLSAGFEARGVDLDSGMLRACQDLGLPAEKADALAFIAALPDESQTLVSAFHLVEHLPFEQLQTFLAEAYRVLKPGGLMILETPNSENILIATTSFYLDPTHQKPIPAALLAFMAEYSGFGRVCTVRLQEDSSLSGKDNQSLQGILAGASPDYSIVAQKSGPVDVLAALKDVLSKAYGVTLSQLTHRYEVQQQQRSSTALHAKTKAEQAEAKAEQAEAKADELANTASQALARLESVYQSGGRRTQPSNPTALTHLKRRRTKP